MESYKYTEKYVCQFADCDKKYDLKPATLMAWAAEIAGNHLVGRGITRQQLWQDGQVFLLTKASISYNKMPTYHTEMNITTWESGTKGTQFIRRFSVADINGEKLCDIESMWVLVDPHSHRLYRPSEYIYGQLNIEGETEAKIEKFKIEDEEFIKDYTFVYSDIDPNGHVNNGVYLRLMSDILPEELLERSIKNLCINFARECMQGDTISLYLKREGDVCYFCGRIGEGKNNIEIKAQF
ncbi:MAG: acyl-ACP thioesterase [Ruminiclostridium sp.]|nr:acyl-ACP thioesterase [Ruminiclostridium sp.]